ncbi:hypothetical protein DERP_000344 [Dermatophagoides pteronyssinus]|uniref:Uncharacterized protein n=1 Tax=Dermatophagoides pteronyssinus TaxID=6956 RepID=A0ABQ8IZX5_DERPT|nr:hypothetical protein DERP_000344 [Dermatophagoides pteronyssinus]
MRQSLNENIYSPGILKNVLSMNCNIFPCGSRIRLNIDIASTPRIRWRRPGNTLVGLVRLADRISSCLTILAIR